MALSPRFFSSGERRESSLAVDPTEKFLPKSLDHSDAKEQYAQSSSTQVVIPIAEPPILPVPIPPPIEVVAAPRQPAVTPLFFKMMLALFPIGVGVVVGQRCSDNWEGMLIGGAAGVAVDFLAWAWVTYGPAVTPVAERPRPHDPWFRFTYSTPRGHIYNQYHQRVDSHASTPPLSPSSSP